MSKIRPVISLQATLILLLLGTASSMSALANRVFVSARSGNDANTCDNILAPCQTFAGAVTKLNPGGEAIVLDSGGYGPVTITQSVTIEAPPGVTAFVHPPSGDAVTINAGASDTVILRGLVLNGGSADGIQVNTVGSLFVEDCTITGFPSASGIAMLGAGNLDVKNTSVKGCFIGVDIANSSGTVIASIDHCLLDGNGAGFRSGTTSPGGSMTTATNTTANNNSQNGWICGAGTSGVDILNLEFCSGSGNGDRGALNNSSNGSSVMSYSNCVFSSNGTFGVSRLSAGPVQSRVNSSSTGNGTAPTIGAIVTFSPI